MSNGQAKEVYIVRHGESYQNIHKNLKRLTNSEVHLTDTGEKQAIIVSNWFKGLNIDKGQVRIYVSSYTRAKETANFIAEALGITDIRENSMLIELDTGI